MSNKKFGSEKPLDYIIVRRRLVLLFVFVVTCVVSLVLFLNHLLTRSIEQNENITELVNVSGRQRMLSQNLAKNVLLYQRTQSPALLVRIDSIQSKIRTNYQLLKNHDFNFEKISWSNSIERYFLEVLRIQTPMLDAAEQLKRTSNTDSLDYFVKELLLFEAEFLPVMEAFTSRYAVIGSSIIRETKERIRMQNYINAFSIILSASIVLMFTLYIIKGYADRLYRSDVALKEVLKSEQQKVEKLEFLTSSINVGIWEKSISKNSENWSEALFRILGYETDEIKGTAEEFLKHVHPDDIKQLNDASQFSIETGMPSTMEIRVKTKSGIFKWLEATGNAKRNPDGKLELLIGGVIDIHEKKLLDIKLNAFVDNAPAAIAMFDTNMDFMFVSQRWVEDYHNSWRQLLGHNFYDIYSENARVWRSIHADCLQEGSVSSGKEDPITLVDGSVRWIKWEVRPWYISKNEVGGLLMFTTDVTENREKRLELNKAKQEAEAASKAKESFLTTMSHEIRTPITAINGLTQILLNEDPRQDQKQHLDLLKFSGDNLLNLINDILDLSKIDADKMVIEQVSFDLKYLLNNIKNALSFRSKERNINFSLSYDEQLPHVFKGDVTRLSQVIFNLAGNALKFTEKGSVSIDARLKAKKKGQITFEISVKDTGIGIPENKREQIFKPFEQADSSVTRNYGGTGMGLYITKKILALMGSQIHLNSTKGKGSNFYFELTLPVGSMNLSTEKLDFNWQDHFKNNDLRLLIAEDSESNQYLINNYLNRVNIAFDFAKNGKEAVEMIASKQYDLIFMDLQMPIMDGYTAARKIRKMDHDYFRRIPIIALTADAFTNVKDVSISAGMNGYISKPFKPSEIYNAVETYTKDQEEPEANFLQLSQTLKEHCEDDDDFIKEFSAICVKSYEELSTEIRKAFAAKDHQILSAILHKIQPLNEILKLQGLAEELSQLKTQAFDRPMDHVLKETELIVKNLKKISLA